MSNKYILGLNFLHSDSSACIFKDELLVAASEEERFTRKKHTSNFPKESIKFCLNKAGIKISDIDYVTINTNPYNNILKKILFVLKNPSSIKIAISSLRNSKKKINIGKILSSISDKDPFK